MITYGTSPHRKHYGSKTATVADVLSDMTSPVLAGNAQPSWLPKIAQVGPGLVTQVLRVAPAEARPGWADEFWALQESTRSAITDLYAKLPPAKTAANSETGASLGWLAAYGMPRQSAAWFARAHTRSSWRNMAVADFAAELATRGPDARRGYVSCLVDDDMVAASLSAAKAQPSPAKQMLLLLIDPASKLARDRGLAPWAESLVGVVDTVAAAHLLRLVPLAQPSQSDVGLAATAFAHVWEAIANSDWRAWDALASYPADVPGDDEWDRGMRVSRAFARSVAAWATNQGESLPQSALPGEVLNAVSVVSGRAAAQLSTELINLFAPPQRKDGTSKKKGKSKTSPVERAWRLAADTFGFD